MYEEIHDADEEKHSNKGAHSKKKYGHEYKRFQTIHTHERESSALLVLMITLRRYYSDS